MGEYAELNGRRIKIGTCEDMYYLRFDQRGQVSPLVGNVDPVKDANDLRFRFPFPDEDNIGPGEFGDAFRAVGVHGAEVPEIGHRDVQFVSSRGFNVMLPCPEGPDRGKHRFNANGYAGAVRIVQQRIWEGKLVLVCECGGCGAKYRVETLDQAGPILTALEDRAKVDESTGNKTSAEWYREIANRIRAGYAMTLP